MISNSLIKELALKHGFDICGITRALPLDKNRGHLEQWLNEGYGEPLEYMTRYMDVRCDPSKIIDSARSVIVCATNYKNEYSLLEAKASTPRIASYALTRDYHKTIRKRLKALLAEIKSAYPTINGRCFTDSAPLFEKQLAVDAGIGWIGRQSLLISPALGSFTLLGEIVIDDHVDLYDSSIAEVGCGECRRCIEKCPVGAINDNRTIDTRKCISCRTVEIDDDSELTLNGWIFGCDECQSCCPHNQRTPLYQNPDFAPIVTPPSLKEWSEMSDLEFNDRFGQTALKRAGLERVKKLIDKL